MKIKWYKIGAVVFMLGLTLTSALLFKTDSTGKKMRVVKTAADLSGAKVGGVKSYMDPEASGIYFESLIGSDISAYREYDTFDDAVAGLKAGEVDAIWACDVTADYAVRRYEGLEILSTEGMAATANLVTPRFSFAFMMPDSEDGKETQKTLNEALEELRSSGTLGRLTDDYLSAGSGGASFTEEDMWSRTDKFRSNHEISGSIDIGITGGAPPVEIIDENGNPGGFCVAFLDEIACCLNTDINIKILDAETAYSQLLAGRVDALLAGAESGNTTQEKKKFLTTSGYRNMYNYRFLVRSEQSPDGEADI